MDVGSAFFIICSALTSRFARGKEVYYRHRSRSIHTGSNHDKTDENIHAITTSTISPPLSNKTSASTTTASNADVNNTKSTDHRDRDLITASASSSSSHIQDTLDKTSKTSPANKNIQYILQRSMVLLLGVGRAVVLKLFNYPEHVSEYGVHWNFFITLFCVWCLADTIHHLFPRRTAPYIAFLILFTYQLLLMDSSTIYTSVLSLPPLFPDLELTVYIFSASRHLGFFSANREGICSLGGLLPLYLITEHISYHIFFSGTIQKTSNNGSNNSSNNMSNKSISRENIQLSRQLSESESGLRQQGHDGSNAINNTAISATTSHENNNTYRVRHSNHPVKVNSSSITANFTAGTTINNAEKDENNENRTNTDTASNTSTSYDYNQEHEHEYEQDLNLNFSRLRKSSSANSSHGSNSSMHRKVSASSSSAVYSSTYFCPSAVTDCDLQCQQSATGGSGCGGGGSLISALDLAIVYPTDSMNTNTDHRLASATQNIMNSAAPQTPRTIINLYGVIPWRILIPHSFRPLIRQLLVLSISLWSVWCLSSMFIQPTSRRLTNLTFILFTLALAMTSLLFALLADCITGCSVTVKVQTLEYMNTYQLPIFLFANVLTGIINYFIPTMYMSPVVSFFILLVYISAVTAFAWLLGYKKILHRH